MSARHLPPVTMFAVILAGCATPPAPAVATPTTAPSAPAPVCTTATTPAPPALPGSASVSELATRTCGGSPLRVRFYDVSQALAALVELPDGRHILVDTGDSLKRAGCGHVCSAAHTSLMQKLATDLGGRPIDLLWITHQHSDHIGGAADIIEHLLVKAYVDNGRDLDVGEISAVRDAASKKGVPVTVVAPGHEAIPIENGADVHLRGIAPSSWLPNCTSDRNLCSILLRIDYCASSILFVGDAETEEESLLDPHGSATLLQVGHHGSDTSSGPAFISKVQPKYAVISAGKQGEGMNKTYCHPRASTVKALTQALGGAGSKAIHSFDATVSCKQASDANWIDVPASDRLWATERDGEIVLTTTGDGIFTKE